MNTPILETPRLFLRLPTVADAQEVFNNWASDADVAKYVRWSVHETIDTTLEYLTQAEQGKSNDKTFDWLFELKETGELIGSGGIFWDDELNMFEIGYVIAKNHWSNGFATEAARAIVDFAVGELKQTSLSVKHAKENIGSGKVIEKLGFVYTKDGEYSSFDGLRIFQCREYILEVST